MITEAAFMMISVLLDYGREWHSIRSPERFSKVLAGGWLLFCRPYCITMRIRLIFCIFTDTPGTFPAAIAQITWPPSQTYTLLTMPIKAIYYRICVQCGRELAGWGIANGASQHPFHCRVSALLPVLCACANPALLCIAECTIERCT